MPLVDLTETDLENLIRQDLPDVPRTGDITRSLIDWYHYRARQIPRRTRQVSYSNEIQRLQRQYPAIDRLAGELRTGGDVGPWLSDRIRKRKADHKADLLFNDWQITHFHLGNIFTKPDKVVRGEALMFACVERDEAVLLSVGAHGRWSDTAVLKLLLQTSPHLMTRWEVIGIAGRDAPTDEQDEQLEFARKNGVCVPVQIDGRVFVPGLGVVTSGHAGRLVHKANSFMRTLASLRHEVRTGTLTSRDARARISWPIGLPVVLRVRLEPTGELTVYDEARAFAFFFDHAPC